MGFSSISVSTPTLWEGELFSVEFRSYPFLAIPPYHIKKLHIRGAWTATAPNQCEEIYTLATGRRKCNGTSLGKKASQDTRGIATGQNWERRLLKLQREMQRDEIGEEDISGYTKKCNATKFGMSRRGFVGILAHLGASSCGLGASWGGIGASWGILGWAWDGLGVS